jgi:predicted amidohydrolase YtcJ
MTGILIRDAEIDGRPGLGVRITDGVITELGHQLPARGEEVLDAAGGAVLPGLCDHHLHLHAIATAGLSVPCGPPATTTELAARLAKAPADAHGWVRGVGYHDEVAGPLDATGLDRLHAGRPVRIQHRSGALWIVNTAGLRALELAAADHPGIERGPDGAPTGRLWRADDWLRTRLPRTQPPDLRPVGERLARLGITHVTDATPDLDAAALSAIGGAMHSGALPQHVHLLGAPLGWTPPAEPRTPTVGPYKIVLADSALPGLAELAERIQAGHAAGRAIAAHCVTREALLLLLAALDAVGGLPGDRIEHAALVPVELVPRLRTLAVVTQPGFLAHRGDDYLRDVPAEDRPDLYRLRSLIEGGVACGLSSDAPYGPVDPWTVIRAAVQRRTPRGQVIGAGEEITARQALSAYLGAPDDPGGVPRRVVTGGPADLVLLNAPLAEALTLDNPVAATIIAGRRH